MLLSFCYCTLSAEGIPVKVPVLMEFAATVRNLATALVICTVLYIMQNCFAALLKILPFVGKK